MKKQSSAAEYSIVWVLLKSNPYKWYKALFYKNGKKNVFCRCGIDLTDAVVDWMFPSKSELEKDCHTKPFVNIKHASGE